MRLSPIALSLLLYAAPAYADESHWRLFVADHAAPLVTAIDLETGETLEKFTLAAPAALHATASQAVVYAVERHANKVVALKSGLEFDSHGDHADLKVAPPALLAGELAGERPVHFVAHDGEIAVFFDGEGVARLVSESEWLAGTIVVKDFATAAPHHGVAIPFGDHLVITEPNKEKPDALPIGVTVRDRSGAVVGEDIACPDLHGEAASGHLLAIACASGLLLATEQDGAPKIEFRPYPPNLPAGKVTTLLGGVGLQYFLGNYGADRVAIIDPAAAESFRLVDLPTRRVHFAVNPITAKFAYIFTEDGNLRELDVLTGKLTRAVQLTEPYSMDGEWSLPRPRVAVAGDIIAVTDPLKGQVHLVDTEAFKLLRALPVGGAPYAIVALGGAGENHG